MISRVTLSDEAINYIPALVGSDGGRVRYTPGGNLRSLSGRHWWRPGCHAVKFSQSVMDSVPRTRTRCPHGSAENTGRTRASSSAVRTKLSGPLPRPESRGERVDDAVLITA